MDQETSKERRGSANVITTNSTELNWRDRFLTPRDRVAHAEMEEHTRKVEEENRQRPINWHGAGGFFCGG